MIEKKQVFIPAMDRETTLHIHLPEHMEEGKRYPVLYMFDGHNLFKNEDATYGKSWGLEEFLNEKGPELILVGVECDHRGDNRMQEYTPYALESTFFGATEGKGAAFMDWLVGELKPQIDADYPTLTDRDNTFIAGSSMGGLMAFYALLHHNDTFSGAGCLSPTIFIAIPQLREEIHDLNPNSRVYFSYGRRETHYRSRRNMIATVVFDFEERLKQAGVKTRHNFTDGAHNESSWEKENPAWIPFVTEIRA